MKYQILTNGRLLLKFLVVTFANHLTHLKHTTHKKRQMPFPWNTANKQLMVNIQIVK